MNNIYETPHLASPELNPGQLLSTSLQPTANCGTRSVTAVAPHQAQWSASTETATTPATYTNSIYAKTTPDHDQPSLANRSLIRADPLPKPVSDSHHPASVVDPGAGTDTIAGAALKRITSGRELLSNALLRICCPGLNTDTKTSAETDPGTWASFKHWLENTGIVIPGSPEWHIRDSVYDFYRTKRPVEDLPAETPDREQQLLHQFTQSTSAEWLYRAAVENNLVALEAYLRNAGVNINSCHLRSTPLDRAVECNQWGMVETLLESGADIMPPPQDYFKTHLLHQLFSVRSVNSIDDKTLAMLTEKILKRHAGEMVISNSPPHWGRHVPLALYAFTQTALSGVDARLMATILTQYPWVRPHLQANHTAEELIVNVILGTQDLPLTVQFLLDLKGSDGQPMIDPEACNTGQEMHFLPELAATRHPNTLSVLQDAVQRQQDKEMIKPAGSSRQQINSFAEQRHLQQNSQLRQRTGTTNRS